MCLVSYRVKTVCRLTGIHRSTLLAWERRYKVVEPSRADNGYRVYSEDDIHRLTRLKSLVDEGHAVSEAMSMLVGGPLHSHAMPLLERLNAFDGQGAAAIAEQIETHSPGQQVGELYMPLLAELGMAWERGETTIAQEHFTSGFVRERLQRLVERSARTEGPLATLLTPPGEKHELGLMGLGIRIAELGWRTDWLGSELPLTELAPYCLEKAPQLICVSLIRQRSREDLNRMVRRMRETVPSEVKIAVGGSAAACVEVQGVITAVSFAQLKHHLEQGSGTQAH